MSRSNFIIKNKYKEDGIGYVYEIETLSSGTISLNDIYQCYEKNISISIKTFEMQQYMNYTVEHTYPKILVTFYGPYQNFITIGDVFIAS